MLGVGERAPSFRLRDLDGQEVSLEEILAAGPAVLAFYKTSCPVCQFTFPFLERIASQGSLRIYAVSQDEARYTNGFNQDYGIHFATLLDEERKGFPASNAFQISVVPSIFLVEQDGIISLSSSGFARRDIEELGRRAGVTPFGEKEYVPEWKSG